VKKRACIQDNFWLRVDCGKGSDACWNWMGAHGKSGYGHVRWDGRVQYAHRIAYILTHNDLADLCVLHRCDNRSCCNPAHLFKGTYSDNNRDKKAKGRAVGLSGELNPAAVLDWSRVRDIRRLYATGCYRQTELARMFGVTQANIFLIVSNKKWKDITVE